jgi:hypothetical protein
MIWKQWAFVETSRFRKFPSPFLFSHSLLSLFFPLLYLTEFPFLFPLYFPFLVALLSHFFFRKCLGVRVGGLTGSHLYSCFYIMSLTDDFLIPYLATFSSQVPGLAGSKLRFYCFVSSKQHLEFRDIQIDSQTPGLAGSILCFYSSVTCKQLPFMPCFLLHIFALKISEAYNLTIRSSCFLSIP